jgi:hypothetical protein
MNFRYKEVNKVLQVEDVQALHAWVVKEFSRLALLVFLLPFVEVQTS